MLRFLVADVVFHVRVICIDLVTEVRKELPWFYRFVTNTYTSITKDIVPADGSMGLFHIRLARLSIFLMALCGTLPLIQDATGVYKDGE